MKAQSQGLLPKIAHEPLLLIRRAEAILCVALRDTTEVGRLDSGFANSISQTGLIGSIILHGANLPLLDPLVLLDEACFKPKPYLESAMFIASRTCPIVGLVCDELLGVERNLSKAGNPQMNSAIEEVFSYEGKGIPQLNLQMLAERGVLSRTSQFESPEFTNKSGELSDHAKFE